MKNLLLLFVFVLLFSSCSTQRAIGNGAYSDISLVRSSDEYTVKRLQEVNTESRAIFGIPIGDKVAKKEGIIVRFNGINLNAQQKFLPTLSMVVLTFVTGSAIYDLIGQEIDEEALSIAASGLAAIPIAGAINNQIWSNAAYSGATWNANSTLLEQNQDVDVFLNPKYQIETKNGLWSQKVKLQAKVMGATIITDN
jgi:hypothetical protein